MWGQPPSSAHIASCRMPNARRQTPNPVSISGPDRPAPAPSACDAADSCSSPTVAAHAGGQAEDFPSREMPPPLLRSSSDEAGLISRPLPPAEPPPTCSPTLGPRDHYSDRGLVAPTFLCHFRWTSSFTARPLHPTRSDLLAVKRVYPEKVLEQIYLLRPLDSVVIMPEVLQL